MGAVNKAIVVGYLGSDPELRYTQNQTPVAQFSVATTESWTGADGQKQEKTEWHRVVAWQKLAEICAKHLAKGRQVYIEGRMQTRSWEDKDKIKRYTTEIVADQVVFLGKADGQGTRPPAPEEPTGRQASRPQGQSTTPPPPPAGASPGIDEIPFMRRIDEA